MLNLVTGANGDVGSSLVDALVLRGEQVRCLVPPTQNASRLRELGVDVRVGTLHDSAALMAAATDVDRVFHCEALVSDWGPLEDFRQANVHAVRAVLAAATRAEVRRFIYVSTTDIYGFPGRPVDESEGPSPRGFPAVDTRIEGEGLVWNHYRRVGLPVTVLRPSNVYGPRCTFLVTNLLRDLTTRNIALVDGGEHVAGLTYVGNLVDAMLLAADRTGSIGQAYNISDCSSVTWRQYVDALADLAEMPHPSRSYSHTTATILATLWETYYRLLGRTDRPPLTRMMVEMTGTDQQYPCDKAMRDLGYRPRVALSEGMAHVGRWLRQEGLLNFSLAYQR